MWALPAPRSRNPRIPIWPPQTVETDIGSSLAWRSRSPLLLQICYVGVVRPPIKSVSVLVPESLGPNLGPHPPTPHRGWGRHRDRLSKGVAMSVLDTNRGACGTLAWVLQLWLIRHGPVSAARLRCDPSPDQLRGGGVSSHFTPSEAQLSPQGTEKLLGIAQVRCVKALCELMINRL